MKQVFPGGREAWLKYITGNIRALTDSCLIKFIVNTDGTASNVEVTTMKNTKLAEFALNAIKAGPKWIPATQNDHVVAAYTMQPVSFKFSK